jgi:hypothetical protein
MDITRNWRLKMSRSQLLATRCPISGAVILPQQSGPVSNPTQHGETYAFEIETDDQPRASAGAMGYARAAR